MKPRGFIINRKPGHLMISFKLYSSSGELVGKTKMNENPLFILQYVVLNSIKRHFIINFEYLIPSKKLHFVITESLDHLQFYLACSFYQKFFFI